MFCYSTRSVPKNNIYNFMVTADALNVAIGHLYWNRVKHRKGRKEEIEEKGSRLCLTLVATWWIFRKPVEEFQYENLRYCKFPLSIVKLFPNYT